MKLLAIAVFSLAVGFVAGVMVEDRAKQHFADDCLEMIRSGK
jgi:hypothetical protein